MVGNRDEAELAWFLDAELLEPLLTETYAWHSFGGTVYIAHITLKIICLIKHYIWEMTK